MHSTAKNHVPGPLVDRPCTEYEAACDEQSAQLTVLEDIVTELEKRLQPVLTPFVNAHDEASVKSESSSARESSGAQLIAGMRYHTSRVTVTNERVRELIIRLCL